jgi:hypothetical protein
MVIGIGNIKIVRPIHGYAAWIVELLQRAAKPTGAGDRGDNDLPKRRRNREAERNPGFHEAVKDLAVQFLIISATVPDSIKV